LKSVRKLLSDRDVSRYVHQEVAHMPPMSFLLFFMTVLSFIILTSSASFGMMTSPVEYSGHYYAVVSIDGGISWYDAKIESESLTLNGFQGHLATVTSQSENDFIFNTFKDQIAKLEFYLGGFQPTGGNWQWVTGESWEYTNWWPGEPNNFGWEDVLSFHWIGDGDKWNNVPHTNLMRGYIIEAESVPEPSTLFLLGFGLAGVGLFRKRFKN
jgi:PEP-CTERM motif/Lectin C-type domain